jgi:hypothetical protein
MKKTILLSLLSLAISMIFCGIIVAGYWTDILYPDWPDNYVEFNDFGASTGEGTCATYLQCFVENAVDLPHVAFVVDGGLIYHHEAGLDEDETSLDSDYIFCESGTLTFEVGDLEDPPDGHSKFKCWYPVSQLESLDLEE